MICTSIQNKSLEQINAILADPSIEMAEIRLDICPIAVEEISVLFRNAQKPLVATCRFSADNAWERLRAAVKAGARFADLELSEEAGMIEKNFVELCRKNGTVIIRSYHNFEITPDLAALKKKVRQCFDSGADIAKIATTAKNFKDSCIIDSLYDWFNDEYLPGTENPDSRAEMIAFAMGELGRVSRVDCLMNGAPFTYASLNANECTALGQLSVEELNGLLYNRKKLYLNRIYDTVPASKSYAQRAIIAAALAQGTSRIYNYTPCADSEAAIEVACALGATISKEYTPQKAVCALVINGIGAYEKTRLHITELRTGESGLLTRLMVTLISLLNDCDCSITGERTLLGRPLKGLKETMEKLGIQLIGDNGNRDICIPFNVNVSRRSVALNDNCGHESDNMSADSYQEPLRIVIDGSNGSQIFSGLMMALPLCSRDSEIIVENPKSVPYLRMTAQVLSHFGIGIYLSADYAESNTNDTASGQDNYHYDTVPITSKPNGTNSVDILKIKIQGRQRYKAAEYVLEGDWSGAANLLVAGAILGRSEVHGLEPDSLQGDSVILDILDKAGAKVAWNMLPPQFKLISKSNNSLGRSDVVTVAKAPLSSFNVSLENAPDLFPIVALLAAFCKGESRIEGTHRLVGKESNRARAIVEMLVQMGIAASEKDNILIVNGESLSSRVLNHRLPKGGRYSSHHDHRIAMALLVASLCTRSVIEIDDSECLAKSFPNFELHFSKSYFIY